MVDVEVQYRAWQSGEQERKGGGGLGQAIEAGKGIWASRQDGALGMTGPGRKADDKNDVAVERRARKDQAQ